MIPKKQSDEESSVDSSESSGFSSDSDSSDSERERQRSKRRKLTTSINKPHLNSFLSNRSAEKEKKNGMPVLQPSRGVAIASAGQHMQTLQLKGSLSEAMLQQDVYTRYYDTYFTSTQFYIEIRRMLHSPLLAPIADSRPLKSNADLTVSQQHGEARRVFGDFFEGNTSGCMVYDQPVSCALRGAPVIIDCLWILYCCLSCASLQYLREKSAKLAQDELFKNYRKKTVHAPDTPAAQRYLRSKTFQRKEEMKLQRKSVRLDQCRSLMNVELTQRKEIIKKLILLAKKRDSNEVNELIMEGARYSTQMIQNSKHNTSVENLVSRCYRFGLFPALRSMVYMQESVSDKEQSFANYANQPVFANAHEKLEHKLTPPNIVHNDTCIRLDFFECQNPLAFSSSSEEEDDELKDSDDECSNEIEFMKRDSRKLNRIHLKREIEYDADLLSDYELDSEYEANKNKVLGRRTRKEIHEDREEFRCEMRDIYSKEIMKIYEKHNPEKADNVDQLLHKYYGKEEVLYRSICDKYKIKNPKDLRKFVKMKNLIIKAYEKFNPSKLDQVEYLLEKYEDREEILFKGICDKYFGKVQQQQSGSTPHLPPPPPPVYLMRKPVSDIDMLAQMLLELHLVTGLFSTNMTQDDAKNCLDSLIEIIDKQRIRRRYKAAKQRETEEILAHEVEKKSEYYLSKEERQQISVPDVTKIREKRHRFYVEITESRDEIDEEYDECLQNLQMISDHLKQQYAKNDEIQVAKIETTDLLIAFTTSIDVVEDDQVYQALENAFQRMLPYGRAFVETGQFSDGEQKNILNRFSRKNLRDPADEKKTCSVSFKQDSSACQQVLETYNYFEDYKHDFNLIVETVYLLNSTFTSCTLITSGNQIDIEEKLRTLSRLPHYEKLLTRNERLPLKYIAEEYNNPEEAMAERHFKESQKQMLMALGFSEDAASAATPSNTTDYNQPPSHLIVMPKKVGELPHEHVIRSKRIGEVKEKKDDEFPQQLNLNNQNVAHSVNKYLKQKNEQKMIMLKDREEKRIGILSEYSRPYYLTPMDIVDGFFDEILCLNCDSRDHRFEDCPFERKVCWNCHDDMHRADDPTFCHLCPLICRVCETHHDFEKKPIMTCVYKMEKRRRLWLSSNARCNEAGIQSSVEKLKESLMVPEPDVRLVGCLFHKIADSNTILSEAVFDRITTLDQERLRREIESPDFSFLDNNVETVDFSHLIFHDDMELPEMPPQPPTESPPKLPTNQNHVEKIDLEILLSRDIFQFALIGVSKYNNVNEEKYGKEVDSSDNENEHEAYMQDDIELSSYDQNSAIMKYLHRKGSYFHKIEIKTKTKIKIQNDSKLLLLISGEEKKQCKKAKQMFMNLVLYWEKHAKKRLLSVKQNLEHKRRDGELYLELVRSSMPFCTFVLEQKWVDQLSRFLIPHQISFEVYPNLQSDTCISISLFKRHQPRQTEYMVFQLCRLISNYHFEGPFWFEEEDLVPYGFFALFHQAYYFDVGKLCKLSNRGEKKVSQAFFEIDFNDLVCIIKKVKSRQDYLDVRQNFFNLDECLNYDEVNDTFGCCENHSNDRRHNYYLLEFFVLNHVPLTLNQVNLRNNRFTITRDTFEDEEWESMDEEN